MSLFSIRRVLVSTLLGVSILGGPSLLAAGPDLIVSTWGGVTPTTIGPGGSLTIKEWSVKNQGTSAAGAFTNGFYLSKDSTISKGDVLLGQTSNSGLATTVTYAYPSATVTIPYDTLPGTYYVGVLLNIDGTVTESSTSNNTAKTSITVSGPDLAFGTSPTFSPTKVAPGGGVNVTAWTIKNLGAKAASSFEVTYYLSSNSSLDASDVSVGSFYVSGLSAGDTSPVTATTVTIPYGTAPGSYYVGVWVDSGASVPEVNETNNTKTTSISVSSGPDLTVTGTVTVTPKEVAPGGAVSVSSIAIKNNGTADASTFTAGYYLSKDSAIDATDTLLSSVSVSPLAAGATGTLAATSLTVPWSAATGAWYLGVLLDPENAVQESVESNNGKSSSLTISSGPDLSVTGSLTLSPTKVAPGGTVTVSAVAIKNDGTGDAGSFSAGYFLSTNSTIDGSDVLLTSVVASPLAAGASATLPSISLTIPSSVTPGTYHVGLFLDPSNAVAESTETNNTKSASLTVASGPDLLITGSLSVSPTKIGPGGTLNVAAISIRNGGVDASGSFSTGYLLSTSTTPSPSDRLLTSVPSSSLAAGASTTLPATTLTVPADVPSGSYRIRLFIDPANEVAESNEGNNSASVAVTVSAGPDLLLSGGIVVSPNPASPGGPVTVSGLSVKNAGTSASTSTVVGYFLSTDNQLDGSKDQLLDTRSVGPLDPGASSALGSVTVTIPQGIPDGTYYLGVWVDPNDAVAESSESNNTVVKSFSVAACSSGLRLTVVQVDASSCPTVRVIVAVTDATGKPVAGLDKSSFCLKEDGLDQAFSLSTTGNAGSELSLAVALDNSSSLTSSAFADEKSAVTKLINLLPASEEVSILSFASTVAVVRDFTSDRGALAAALAGLAYQSQGLDTALYDACLQAVEAVGARAGLHGVVVMTDGLDDASTATQAGVISRAQWLQVPVYTIGFGTADPNVLRAIAEETGGVYYPSSSSSNLQQIAAQLGNEISSQYVLTYTTGRADGNTHGLEVCVGSVGCRQQVTTSVRCPGAGTPDLAIDSIRAVDSSGAEIGEIVAGSRPRFSIRIANQGAAYARSSSVQLRGTVDGVSSPIYSGRISSLPAPGTTKDVTVDSDWAPVVGSYRVRFVVDALQEESESDEGNNETSRAYSVVPPPTSGLVADFVAIPESPRTGDPVSFLDRSTGGPTSWAWTFGPAGASSTAQNPSYTYATSGSYTVTLTIRKGSASATRSRTIVVTSGSDCPGTGGSTFVSRVVPIVLDVRSANARYRTELVITNRGSGCLTVRFQYNPSIGGVPGGVTQEVVAPGRQRVIPDAVGFFRGRGLGGPDGTNEGGTVLLSFPDAESEAAVGVLARTTTATVSPQPVGAAGLSYAGLPPAEAVSSTATLYGLRQDSTDRSNVAVFNPTPDAVTVRVTAFAGDGSGYSRVVRDAETLPGFGWVQYSSVFANTAITQGWVVVEKTGGSGLFSAYGVINDNGTSDGSFVLPTAGSFTGSRVTVPVLVETSAFRSELVLANRSSSNATLSLSYVESASPQLGAGGSASVTLRPKEQRILPDAVEFLRRSGVSVGARGAATYAGALRVTVAGAPLSEVFAGARTASQSPAAGQFGLFTPGVYAGQEASGEAFLYGLRADSTNRSNVAVLNAGTSSEGSVTLEIRSFDGDSGGAERGSPEYVTLSPGRWQQSTNFLKDRGISNGWVRVTRSVGTAPWIAYGVVNDGANPGERTGDGAYVPMTTKAWAAPPPPPTEPNEVTYTLPGGVPLVMVRIPAGTFQMGSPTTERSRGRDEILHAVTLTSDYYIGKYEVTQAQWAAVMGTNPSDFSSCGGNCPVERVSWDDIHGANGFIAKLNQVLGTTKFRLPTEAEWERAARGGTQTRFSFGDAPGGDDSCGANAEANPYVWWCGNAGGTTRPVGMKGANPNGLYDMHGNVWEWVEDWYGDYASTAQTNPTGPATGSRRVVRSGGWFNHLRFARSAYRGNVDPGARYGDLGFRLSRSQ